MGACMSRFIVAVALLVAGTAVAADSNTLQLRNTEDLVRVCSTAQEDVHYLNAVGFCHGVLVGAYRYYDSIAKPATRYICPPNPIPTRVKVMDDFVRWAKANPAYMKDSAVDTLFRYLGQTYPCKQ